MDFENFSFLSSKKIDKVIYKIQDSVSVSGFSIFNVTTTDISYAFLPFLSVSFDGITWFSDESPSYTNGDVTTDLSISGTSYPGIVRLAISCPGYSGTVYYRILGVKNDI